MEFKDRLKALRQERKISQQALADAIFVSRSAVAKWENGLGIPGRESYLALLSYFGVGEDELPLNEEGETDIVQKNKKIRELGWIASSLSAVVIFVLSLCLVYALMNGYGFTPDMAAGEIWADEERIVTPEYVFYYYSLPMKCEDPAIDTSRFLTVDGLAVVKKQAVGYLRIDVTESKRDVYSEDGEHVGIVYSFKGKNGYYHIYRNNIKLLPEGGFNLRIFDTVRIKEESYTVFRNSYFETPFELYEFWIGNEKLCVN